MDEITALCIVRDSLPGVLSVTQERAWQLVEEKFKSTNTGSPKSLCLSCAGAYSCPAQKIVQTVILACKGYEA